LKKKDRKWKRTRRDEVSIKFYFVNQPKKKKKKKRKEKKKKKKKN